MEKKAQVSERAVLARLNRKLKADEHKNMIGDLLMNNETLLGLHSSILASPPALPPGITSFIYSQRI
jgi:hypothetical protein